MHEIRLNVKLLLLVGTAILVMNRMAFAWLSLRAGDESAFLSIPLSVIFPAALVILLVRLPAAKSREGILMRLGTLIQLMGIIALPNQAIYLALGLPVVFLLVEIYTTRLPTSFRDKVSRVFVT